MKKIKCLNTGGYKLTEGKTYEVLHEEEDYYILVNDNNRAQRYSSGYFEEIEEQVEIEVIPEPEPVKTEQDLINSIGIDNNGNVFFLDFNNNVKIIGNNLGTEARMAASCGIGDVTGLNSQCTTINNKLNDVQFEDDDYISLRKALLTASIKQYVLTNPTENRAMFILSTSPTHIADFYITALDELANLTSQLMQNPNSDNQIKFWTFYKQ